MNHTFVDTTQATGRSAYQCVLCKVSRAKYMRTKKKRFGNAWGYPGCPCHASHAFYAKEYASANDTHTCLGCRCESTSPAAEKACPTPYKPSPASGHGAHWLNYAMELGL